MDAEKYNRSVALLCPTCGNSDLEILQGTEHDFELVRCPSCGRELRGEELINENSENIATHLDEMKEEITRDVGEEIHKMLKDAFKGNKYIKIG